MAPTLPKDIGTGFAEVREWEFNDCHPVILAWFGRHSAENAWVPTHLLAYLVENGLLKIREAIISFGKQFATRARAARWSERR
ncbi:MAG: hypothetical protein GXN93_04710 [Candidatus Diapherotrites archaeon]|nr:hypothetical protein [Candidatus Diapherotrites archaeon]